MVKQHHKFSKKNPDYKLTPNVRCVWFPCEQVKYIYERLKAENADWLRVYFGRYPKKDTSGKDFDHPDTNTVVFVSTKVIDGVSRVDYFDEKINMIPQNRGEQCEPSCNGTELAIE